jgi:hypothetical protein
MLRWWVDDTDFQSDAAVGTPDVFVLGGVIATDAHSGLWKAGKGVKRVPRCAVLPHPPPPTSTGEGRGREHTPPSPASPPFVSVR